MALELLLGGATSSTPITNHEKHDLEGFFYVFAALCVWFHAPYTPKVCLQYIFMLVDFLEPLNINLQIIGVDTRFLHFLVAFFVG